MIIVENLCKEFNGVPVVRNFSGVFPSGKVSFIIGASGSGKTTVIKCMTRLFPPTSGKIFYDNINITDLSEDELLSIREKIGFVFQGGALFDYLTVIENVKFPLRVFTNLSEKEIEEKALWALSKVGLADVPNKYPSELSGGMKKRAAISRAIVTNPKYFFFDEPTSGLDPNTARKIDKLIKELTLELNTTTIVISHDVRSVFEIADNVIFLHNGEKVWEGPPSQITSDNNPLITKFIRNALI